MRSKRLVIENKNGNNLSVRLDSPVDGNPEAYALLAHCLTCTRNLLAISNLSRALTRNKIAVLRFDFTGLGEIQGDSADADFSSNVEDLVAVATWMEREFEAPRLLIGHSLGGAAVLLAAQQIPSVKGIATIGAPSDAEQLEKYIVGKDAVDGKGVARIQVSGRPFTIEEQFLKGLKDKRVERSLPQLKAALLILHSPQDRVVDVKNAERIFSWARHPKSFVSLQGADHFLTDSEDSIYAGQLIAAWCGRYLSVAGKTTLVTDRDVVVMTGENGYTTEIRAGKHALLADEPEGVGGKDRGPTPYHLLSAALGSCTSITLRMYADRKGWPLKEIRVHLEHDKVHAEDCAHCEDKDKKVDRIVREIELIGDLDKQQRERLLDIADKCPVHKTLHSDIYIKSSLK